MQLIILRCKNYEQNEHFVFAVVEMCQKVIEGIMNKELAKNETTRDKASTAGTKLAVRWFDRYAKKHISICKKFC